MRRLKLWLRSLLQRAALEKQLSDEMEFHLAEQRAEFMGQGMSAGEADAAARRLFGSRVVVEEECRDQRRTRWLEDLAQDTSYAWRSFAHSPSFTLVAVLTLALGIGANASFFSAAYGILFRPLPYPVPDRLLDMQDGIGAVGPVTALRDLSRAVDYAGYQPDSDLNLQSGGETSKISATIVTWNLARVLKVAPARGRWFQPGEEVRGVNRVAVLSDGTWRRRFGADPAILGKRITLDEVPFEIIGVMPAAFAFPTAQAEIWIPVGLDPRDVGYMWGGGNMWPIGRLRDGMTLAAAQTELSSAIDRVRAMFPWRMPDAWGAGARVVLRSEALTRDVRPKLFALATAALLLLLIACVNVANLLLARATRREREFAMRAALGAGRTRLFRQLMAENLLLVLMGGTAGLLTAAFLLRALPLLLSKDTPRLQEIHLDATLILAAACSMVVTLLLFSVAPLFGFRRSGSRVGKASRQASSISLSLIGVELALATMLLIGAGLMARTLWNLANVDTGVRGAAITSARISAGPSRCVNPKQCAAWIGEVNRTLLRVPSVRSVSWSNTAPLGQEVSFVASEVQDHPRDPRDPAYVLWQTSATPGYFRALGIPLLAGRLFNEGDAEGSVGVLIISQSTARRFWPNESAIGKRVRPMSDRDWKTVVGVVGDVAQYSVTGFPSFVDGAEYRPLAQMLPSGAKSFRLTLLIESAEAGIGPVLQAAMRRDFPDVVLSRVEPLELVRAESVADQRSTAWLLALLAGLGLFLGAAGVYGVISNRAAQRTHEIGIRMALGASAGKVVAMLLRETVVVSLAGALVGVGAAYGLSRFLRSLLFGVSTNDAVTLLVCPVVLLAAALVASAIPGVRASRADPALTLREE